MKHFRNLLTMVIALTLSLSVTSALTVASADTAPEVNSDIYIEQMDNEITTLSAKPGAPNMVPTVYNTAVAYTWYAGENADALAFVLTGDTNEMVYRQTYTEIVYPPFNNTKYCELFHYRAKSYNTSTKTYSDTTTVNIDSGSQIRHGTDCRYQYIDKYNFVMSSGGDFPTSYDQPNFIWEHHSGNDAILKGTISYNNDIADIQVDVPWIGLKTSTVTVGGVTFYFRTGPNKCSIKVSQSGITSSTFRFAFARAYK